MYIYNVRQVEKVAQRYKQTGEDSDFKQVLKVVDPLIDVFLGLRYSSIKHEWEDLKQEVILKLWKNRTGLCFIKSKRLYLFLRDRIRRDLLRAAKKIKDVQKNEDEIVELAELRVNKYIIDEKDMIENIEDLKP